MPNVIITMNATTAAMTAMISEPATNHAAAPMMPAPTVEPIGLAEDAAQDAADAPARRRTAG